MVVSSGKYGGYLQEAENSPYCGLRAMQQSELYNACYENLKCSRAMPRPGLCDLYYGNPQYPYPLPGNFDPFATSFVRDVPTKANEISDAKPKLFHPLGYRSISRTNNRISLVGIPFNICESIAEIYRPQLLRYPEFADHVTELKLVYLQKAPRLDHQHVGKVWLGLNTAKAEELMHLERAFKTALEDLLQDQLKFISQCIEGGRPSQTDKYGNVRYLSISLLDIVNELERYYKSHIHKFHWITSLGNIYKTLARFVCTHDCFVCLDPSSDSADRLSVGINFHPTSIPTNMFTAPTTRPFVEAVWYPDHISIDPSDHRAREGEQFILYPYHKPSMNPRLLSPDLAQRQMFFETSEKWLKWDPLISGFVGTVPFLSEVEENELNVSGEHQRFTLPIAMALTIRDYFDQTVRYQQTFKAMAKIIVERGPAKELGRTPKGDDGESMRRQIELVDSLAYSPLPLPTCSIFGSPRPPAFSPCITTKVTAQVAAPSCPQGTAWENNVRGEKKQTSTTDASDVSGISPYFSFRRADYEDFPIISDQRATEFSEYGDSLLKASDSEGEISPPSHDALRNCPVPVPAYLSAPAQHVSPRRSSETHYDEGHDAWSTGVSSCCHDKIGTFRNDAELRASRRSSGAPGSSDPEDTITGRSHPWLIHHEDKARFAEALREMMEEEREMLGSDLEDVFLSSDSGDSVVEGETEGEDESGNGHQYVSDEECENDAGGGYEGYQGVPLSAAP